jgi:hypothetical protein
MIHVNFASPFVLFFLVFSFLHEALPDDIALLVPANSKSGEVTHNNDLMRKGPGDGPMGKRHLVKSPAHLVF